MTCSSSPITNIQIIESYVTNPSNQVISTKEFQPLEKEINYKAIDSLISNLYLPTLVTRKIIEIERKDKQDFPEIFNKIEKLVQKDQSKKDNINIEQIEIEQIEKKFQLKSFIIYKLLDLRFYIITKKIQFLAHPEYSSFDQHHKKEIEILNKQLVNISKRLIELIYK